MTTITETILCPHCGTDVSSFTNNHLIAHLAFCRADCCKGRSLEHRFTGHRVAGIRGYHTSEAGNPIATVVYHYQRDYTGPYVAQVATRNLIAYAAPVGPVVDSQDPTVEGVPFVLSSVNPALTP